MKKASKTTHPRDKLLTDLRVSGARLLGTQELPHFKHDAAATGRALFTAHPDNCYHALRVAIYELERAQTVGACMTLREIRIMLEMRTVPRHEKGGKA